MELSKFDLVNITLRVFSKSVWNLLQCNLECQLLHIEYVGNKLDGHLIVDSIAISTPDDSLCTMSVLKLLHMHWCSWNILITMLFTPPDPSISILDGDTMTCIFYEHM